jgi:hypothetical protein
MICYCYQIWSLEHLKLREEKLGCRKKSSAVLIPLNFSSEFHIQVRLTDMRKANTVQGFHEARQHAMEQWLGE